MARVNRVFVDTEKNRIEFLDVRYYLHENGQWYPSSTTVLDAYPKNAAFYEWLKKHGENADEIRDAAGDRGSIVHNLTERYDNGEVVDLMDTDGSIKYKQVEWSMFERYVEFCERFQPTIVENELHLVSSQLGYGGTLDRIITLNGKNYLIDIKTSNALYNHYWLQMASYVKLYNEYKPEVQIDGTAVLWLNAKTRGDGRKDSIQGKGWQLAFSDKEIDYHWRLFRATYALWMEENKDYKPRNISYSLTHKK